MNNNSNNCGGCGTTCSECGRPWAICKQDGGCGCNKCKDIKFCEYGRMANGCVREKQPGCPMQAVIPSVTVESIEGIKNLADCLVHVSDINTTFYIDDKHRPIITWAGPIDIPGYDMEGNPNNYRDQIVTDVANQIAVIYDKSGNGYLFGLAENLDVQDEINNKLDEMAEDGTIEEMLSRIVQTSYLYDEIEVNEYLDEETNTHYWITHIPHLDKNGNLIQIKHGLANDVTDNNLIADEDTRNFACRSGATIAINASVFFTSGEYENHIAGTIIKDGALICDYPISSTPETPHSILGVKADNTLEVYPIGTTYASLIADGVVNTFCGFDRVVTGSTITPTFANYYYQWNLIGQNSTTKDIYLFECNGKDFYGEKGMTLPQACQKLVDLGCDFAYRLDQGGSTTLCHNGTMLNVPTDSIGQEVRKVPDFLYFGKTPSSEIDNAFFVGNKERSEASINAQFNKAKVTYLNNVESNQLRFNSPSKTTESTGLIFSLRKQVGTEDEHPDVNMVISPDVEGLEKSINLVDTEQNPQSTILRILPLAKRIRFGANESSPTIANFLTPTEQIAANVDVDGITECGFVFVNYTSGTSPNNRPYQAPFFLLTLKAWASEMFQLAIPMTGGFTQGDVKIKARIKTSQSWQNWINI